MSIKNTIICVRGTILRSKLISENGTEYKLAGYFTPTPISGFFELHRTNTDWYILKRKVVL